ncbi:hypothetical protein OV320_6175 [Actinobacteria bacterium OV320]|nr:hypothetical protein OV320_6175 [Actinobacteria bacterium OV320]
MVGGQGRQLRDEPLEPRSAEGEFGVVAPLQQEQPGLPQASHEGVAAQVGRESAQRGASPQRESGRALTRDAFPVPGGVRAACRGDVPLEHVDVELAVFDPEPVAGRHRAQPLGIVEQPTQPGHVIVQRGLRGHRRRAAPQRLLERLDGHDPARVEEQGRQQGTYLRAADGVVGRDTRLALGIRRVGRVQDRWAQQPEPQPVPPHHAAHRPSTPGPYRGSVPESPCRVALPTCLAELPCQSHYASRAASLTSRITESVCPVPLPSRSVESLALGTRARPPYRNTE